MCVVRPIDTMYPGQCTGKQEQVRGKCLFRGLFLSAENLDFCIQYSQPHFLVPK